MTTTTTTPRRGLTVRFYPERIPDDALASLAALSVETLPAVAPTFIAWLCQWIQSEQERRIYGDLSERGFDCEPPECDLPKIPFTRWDNSEVAGALEAVTFLSYSVSDPMAGEFIDRLTMAVMAIAAFRLREKN